MRCICALEPDLKGTGRGGGRGAGRREGGGEGGGSGGVGAGRFVTHCKITNRTYVRE